MQVTEEMIENYKGARAVLNGEQRQGRPPASDDLKIAAGIAAVLEIFSRQQATAIRQAYERGQCSLIGLTALIGPIR